MRLVLLLPVVLVACSTPPSAKSPLREELAKADTSDVESAVRSCLTEQGWKVDDVGSVSGGSNVVTAYKAKDQTDVYIHPGDQKPRITGGPDDGSPFWKCLGGQLSGGASDKTDQDKGDKDKDDKSKGDKDKPADKP
ncbi:MAG TPA: hypothetical protein VGL81_11930 [Polyangiaceae bacterium]|jgi:hypothetical protein